MALHRHIPHALWIAGLVLIIIAALGFMLVFARPPLQEPVTVNASTGVPITADEVPGIGYTSITATLPALNMSGNNTGIGSPADTAGPVSNTPSATGSREVPLIDTSSLEGKVHARINSIRQEHQLPILGPDPGLSSLARAHSRDMAANGYFGHLNLKEWDATARGAAVGYTCHKTADPYFTYAIAENIFATYQYGPVILDDGRTTGVAWSTEDEIAEEAVDAWMHSPEHRDNILGPAMAREGIGIAISEDKLVFITQDLC